MLKIINKNFDIIKKSFIDAFNSDGINSPINDYNHEKGKKVLKVFMPKSDYFEMKCFEVLDKIYGCGLKKILVDIMIPNATGRTTQLDLVFISRSGIYVVEAKNYSCIVEYNDDKTWLRREFNGKVSKFQSPIEQNENHINNLRKMLNDYNEKYFNSVVVFADTCVIKCDKEYNKYNTKVLNFADLKRVIKNDIKSHEIILSDEDIYKIYNELSQYARRSASEKNRHIDYVNMVKH